MSDIMTAAHAGTTLQSIHETARQLVAHLGPTAVSYLAGAKNSKQSLAWARADGPEPRDRTRQRLLAAHRIWAAISQAESDYVARNWFIANNPRLEEQTPLAVLRDGDISAAINAARAFLDGTDG